MQTNFEQLTTQLVQALEISMNTRDHETRKQAEQFIVDSQRQPNYMISLITIASN